RLAKLARCRLGCALERGDPVNGPDTRDPKRSQKLGDRLPIRPTRGGLRLWAGVLGVVSMAAPSSAWAQTQPADGSEERAAQMFQEANALYDQKRYAEAEALYESAWKVS